MVQKIAVYKPKGNLENPLDRNTSPIHIHCSLLKKIWISYSKSTAIKLCNDNYLNSTGREPLTGTFCLRNVVPP